MTITVGDTLPDATFSTFGPDGPEPRDTNAVFAGRRVALFAVPGAFTPTCSARHLPGFVEQADAIRAKGVDAIACTAVNDVFVMKAWGEASGVGDSVLMLADGNGDFARAIGMEADSSRFGMGTRSRRYAMIVDDCRVAWVSVEEPGGYGESSADSLLKAL